MKETLTKTFWATSVDHRVLGSTLFILCGINHRMTIDWVITRTIVFLIFLPAGRYYSCQWLIWALYVSNLCVCACASVHVCMHACIWVYGGVGMGGCMHMCASEIRKTTLNVVPQKLFTSLFCLLSFLFFWNSSSRSGSGWLGTPYVDRLASNSLRSSCLCWVLGLETCATTTIST